MIQSFSAAMARSTVTYIHSQCRRLAGRRASSRNGNLPVVGPRRKGDVDAATDPEEKQERKGVDGGVFKSTGRYNASPTSMWRALTEYESLYNTSDAIVTCKRLWISSRVGCSVIRLQSATTIYSGEVYEPLSSSRSRRISQKEKSTSKHSTRARRMTSPSEGTSTF